MVKNALATFGYFFQNFGKIFTKSSGHTDKSQNYFFIARMSWRHRRAWERDVDGNLSNFQLVAKTRNIRPSQVRRLKLID